MKLSVNVSDPPIVALALLKASNLDCNLNWGDQNVYLVDGISLKTTNAITRYLALSDKSYDWFGHNLLEQCEVNHWIAFCIGPLSCDNQFEECIAYIDKLLNSLTYLVGNQYTLADIYVWSKLCGNTKWNSLIAANRVPANIFRWYKLISQLSFVVSTVKSLPKEIVGLNCKEDNERVRKEEGKFVELPGAEMGKVVVRFPPEASGYLHIGHAKAALLNQHYKDIFNGKLIMRFDDTNPAKEKEDFEKAILEDLEMLQIKYDTFSHTSNYFDIMLEMCEKLMTLGLAYVDDTEADTMKIEREQKIASKNRNNGIEKNLEMWKEMRSGTSFGQKCCVRAKINMESLNGCMRDPTIYRCKNESHPRTGDKYKVYPTYDFACPIVDSIEGVTHCLRTTEYHDRDEQFFWFIEALGLRKPYIWEYSRLNMMNTVLSKRKLTWFVENRLVNGWDDPRMPTVRGILRRGMTIEGLKQFIIAQGSSKSVVSMEWDKIWAINKKVIDPIAPRFTAIESRKNILVSVDGVVEECLKVQKHPKNPEVGEKLVWVGPEVLVDEADAVLFKEGENVTFINWGNITIKEIIKQGDKIISVKATPNLDDKNYKKTMKITWLSKTKRAPLIPCLCVYYDHIISKPILGKDEDFKQYIGHQTEFVVEMLGDPELAHVRKSEIIQLQRKGFFICDRTYSTFSPYSCEEAPICLLSIPDGHSKEMPTTLPKFKDIHPKETTSNDENVTNLLVKINEQGNKVRSLKAEKADKKLIDEEVKILLNLKVQFKSITGQDWKPDIRLNVQSSQESLDANLISKKIVEVGNHIRDLKSSKADKNIISSEVNILLDLKAKYKTITGEEWKPNLNSSPVTKNLQNETYSDAGTLHTKIVEVGNKIRNLKSSKASKNDISLEVESLLNLKRNYKSLTGQEWIPNIEKNLSETLTKPNVSNLDITPESLAAEIVRVGNIIRNLKSTKADKVAISDEVKVLLDLKNKYKTITGKDWKPEPLKNNTNSSGDMGKSGKSDAVVLSEEISQLGNCIRSLKSSKADKNIIQEEVKKLIDLKLSYKNLTGEEWKPLPVSVEANLDNRNTLLNDLSKKIKEQGDNVRQLKSSNSPKEKINESVQQLLCLKEEYKKITGIEFQPEGRQPRGSPKSKSEDKVQSQKTTKVDNKKSDSSIKKVTRLGLEATKEDNLPEWYSQVIVKGEMIEYYDVSGCYILRPWAFSIWEIIKDWFDKQIKILGVKNCYFPIFVSRNVLEKEKTHISDFAPEVAWVTKSGDSDLAEPIAIRPTSETVMYPAYAKWIQSYRDLPIKLNQWNNVVRWEFKHPQPFLRTREFLWQEGHTAFASKKEAEEEVYNILDLYSSIYTDLLAIPVVKGRKTEKEKFAGGDFTLTVEAYISASGRAIQGATSHHLGQNFSKMFDIVYEDPDTQDKNFVFQNSWGFTTRTIGVLIMVHADNQGLVLPPRVASIQAIIVPCGMSVNMLESEKECMISMCEKVKGELLDASIRAELDLRDNYSAGWKFNHWELKGVPLRLEIGPQDVKSNQVIAVRRDNGSKKAIPQKNLIFEITNLLEDIQKNLLLKATHELNKHMVVSKDWTDFCQQLENKNLIQSPFCGEINCEDKIKEDSARKDKDVDSNAPSMGAKSLCIPFSSLANLTSTDKCIHPECTRQPKFYTLFGRSY